MKILFFHNNDEDVERIEMNDQAEYLGNDNTTSEITGSEIANVDYDGDPEDLVTIYTNSGFYIVLSEDDVEKIIRAVITKTTVS